MLWTERLKLILYIVFYMPIDIMIYSGYLTNIPLAFASYLLSLILIFYVICQKQIWNGVVNGAVNYRKG